MPIHVQPLSRRQFLAATAAGLLGARGLRAAPPSDEHSWALLSDPHIAADRAAVNNRVKMADNLAAVVQEVLAQPARPAQVLVNGDCAFKAGLPGDYATFAKLIEPLREAGLPLHLTLGNHDDRIAFRAALESELKAERLLPDRNVSIVRTPRANFFMLDSLDIVDKAPGKLGDAQIAWLGRALDAHADKPAIVCNHHNMNETRPETALIDTKALLAVMVPRKQVKAYVFGHTHVWSVKEHASGVHLVNLPPVGYAFAADQPSGWVHCAIAEDGAKLTMNSLNKSHRAHGQVFDLKWRKS